MQKTEQGMLRAQPCKIGGNRLLDLDDQRRLVVGGRGIGNDRTGRRIVRIRITRQDAGTLLHGQRMSVRDQRRTGGRQQCHPPFLWLYFAWYAYFHAVFTRSLKFRNMRRRYTGVGQYPEPFP